MMRMPVKRKYEDKTALSVDNNKKTKVELGLGLSLARCWLNKDIYQILKEELKKENANLKANIRENEIKLFKVNEESKNLKYILRKVAQANAELIVEKAGLYKKMLELEAKSEATEARFLEYQKKSEIEKQIMRTKLLKFDTIKGRIFKRHIYIWFIRQERPSIR